MFNECDYEKFLESFPRSERRRVSRAQMKLNKYTSSQKVRERDEQRRLMKLQKEVFHAVA